MKRKKLLKHLDRNECELAREGKKHSIYWNPKNNKTTSVLRHNEIDDFLAMKICQDLGISPIK